MANQKLRGQILFEAARLMYQRQETEYFRAKLKAARKICRGWVKPSDLPSNAEIREQIQSFARIHEGQSRLQMLREMRIEALRLMRLLSRFRPRLIGSTLTGHVRKGSDIDIHVFASSIEAVTNTLDEAGLFYHIEHKQVRKQGEERVFTHVHIKDRFRVELTVYSAEKAHYVFKSSITGKPIERASIAELEQFLQAEYPEFDFSDAVAAQDESTDRFDVYRALLLPLESVQQSRKYHPEGDALYHSLQVYDLACDELPYDEEFLLAALLHDVGKAIDPDDHVAAGLDALDGFISERTAWLIENHMLAHSILDQTIGARAHRRLKQTDDYEELLLLNKCDREGRVSGADVPDLDDALDELREMSARYGL